MPEHEHQWGPLERSRLAGTVHRKCQVPGCKVVNAGDDDDDTEETETIPANYVAVDITGRLSGDENTLEAAKAWMDSRNPDSGDCVVWCKPHDKMQERFIAAIRKGKEWHDFG